MRSKRKLIISMLVVSFVLLSIIATIAIAFALTQQTIKTSLNIGYTVEDIDGTASASYTIGGVTESLVAMKGTNVIGDTLVFKAADTEDAGNLMFPEDALALTSQNDNVVIQYTYSNTGAKHYIASMDFAANIEADNMKVEYSINGTDYSEQRYAVVVPANTSNRSYWIKISIADKAKSASFTGDFEWILNGCDPQSDDYLTIASSEFQATGTAGEYSVKLNGDGYLPGGEVVFPSVVNGDTVTTIAQNTSLTQAQKNMVKSVYIPDSVTTIGESAFENYTNLQTVTLEQNEAAVASAQNNSGLTTIGKNSFKNCTKLKQLIIPSTITSFDTTALTGCTSLKNMTIDTMNSNVVSAVKSLANTNGEMHLIIGNSVTSIEAEAFFGCSGLTSVTIGNSVTSIGPVAFYNCSGLTSVTIGNSVTNIERDAFSGCTSLTGITVDTNNTTYYSEGNCIITKADNILILGCKTSVIPNSVTSIGQSAFPGCSGLTSIEIPDSVTSIGIEAFSGCSGLTSVTIGNSVTSIWEAAFFGCSGLTSVIFLNPTGWATSSTTITEEQLTDPSNAAKLLTDTYSYYYWERK